MDFSTLLFGFGFGIAAYVAAQMLFKRARLEPDVICATNLETARLVWAANYEEVEGKLMGHSRLLSTHLHKLATLVLKDPESSSHIATTDSLDELGKLVLLELSPTLIALLSALSTNEIASHAEAMSKVFHLQSVSQFRHALEVLRQASTHSRSSKQRLFLVAPS